jgi:hypothetical protein
MLAPDLALQLELGLSPLKLAFQTFHESFAVHDTGHLGWICCLRRLRVVGLSGIGSSDILGISEHEV